MPALPKPSNFVASLLAILVILGVFVFVIGIGAAWLQYQDAQFNLIAGFLFGAAGTTLAFYFGSSKSEERKTEALIAPPPDAPPGTTITKTTTTAPPVRETWTPAERAARLGTPLEETKP